MKGQKWGVLAAIGAIALFAGILLWRTAPWAGEQDGQASISEISSPLTLEALEAEAQANPDDPRGWQRLGLAQFQANSFDLAVGAYENAVKADGQSALLWSSLGEARVMASRADPLPPTAIEAFQRALELDSGDPRARYFLAVKRDLDGDHAGAISDWLALLADTPPGAAWENDLMRTIQQVGAINDIDIAARLEQAAGARNILPGEALAAEAQSARGPTTDQMQAAAALSPTQQQEMAEGMVARLAARLENEPGDTEGWIMLMRSYRQMGRNSAAKNARDKAISANPAARRELVEAAESLGIEG